MSRQLAAPAMTTLAPAMTTLAPAMTTLADAMISLADGTHPGGPIGVLSVGRRLRVLNAVVDRAGAGHGETTGGPRAAGPEAVTGAVTEAVTEEVTGGARIELLAAGQIAMTSGAGQCSCRRSRGCLSRRSPTT